ncbi:class I lanthipeptide [Lacinutrix sp. Hel_I_90]|uniref:class I lanthipeptide n=1 Tax=Lacinutrix sp. Hel_I_90 TaxID=1249999 RepID=UPI000B053BE5|nr:class I lanthipeptide [Lacinutrix sp. Hel_I_90]
MKTQNTKLILNKSAIVELQPSDLQRINGGSLTDIIDFAEDILIENTYGSWLFH